MKKTVVALCALIFFICGVLSGCVSGNENKTVITFSSWGSQSEIEILKPLLKKFEEENPDVRIEFLHIPQNYFQKLHLLFASKLAPDVVFVNNFYSLKYINAGLLEDLSDEFKDDKKFYFKKAIESASYNGRLYVVPRDVSALVIYYNKDIFDKYKIAYPDKSWTIKEFQNTAIKIRQAAAAKNETGVYAVGYETDSLYWLPFLFSEGGGLIEEADVIIDKPQSIEMLQFYADLCCKHHVAPGMSQSASLTMGQMFLQGRLAMHLSGRWLVPKYRKDANFNWDIVNFPHGKEGSIVGLDSSGYAVSKQSKHKSEAIRLIKFLSSKSSAKQLAKSGLIVPARKDAAYSQEFLANDKKPEHAEIFLEVIDNAKPTPVSSNYRRMNDILQEALEPLFIGEKRANDVITSDLVKELKKNL